eukprot:10648349-Karenia_brevis.AAC.1
MAIVCASPSNDVDDDEVCLFVMRCLQVHEANGPEYYVPARTCVCQTHERCAAPQPPVLDCFWPALDA